MKVIGMSSHNRIEMLKPVGAIGIVCVFISISCLTQTRPRIVMIMADDPGERDLPVYGNPYNEAPNIDKLAAHSAIRQRDYKLIHDWSGRLLLHNIAQDPFEKRDMSETMPDKTRALFVRLHDWLDTQVDVKYHPALNPNYRPDKEARPRPFIDLRAKYLGAERAIRSPQSDPRLKPKP